MTRNDTRHQPKALDTGQLLLDAHDTGQKRESLVVAFHEVHRIDGASEGERELVTSTLKYFELHVACQDSETAQPLFHRDGTTLVAAPVYEDGTPVLETSATGEPPLLASAGGPPKAVIEGGVALFKLRLTVLSSLCNKRSFAIHVTAEGAPHLAVTTACVKTITKLKRTPREGSAAARLQKLENAENRSILSSLLSPKRALHDGTDDVFGELSANKSSRSSPTANLEAADAEAFSFPLAELTSSCVSGLAEEVDGCGASLATLSAPDALLGGRSYLDAAATGGASANSNAELWEEVSKNGAKLLALQDMQTRLFRELRALKEMQGSEEQATPLLLT